MHLNRIDQIEDISQKCAFCIFDIASTIDQSAILPKAYHIKPADGESSISIEQVRALDKLTNTKQSKSLTFVFENADLMSISANNAFLKKLEEPGENIHYVFLTSKSSKIIPTVHSRAFLFIINRENFNPSNYDKAIFEEAKAYLAAKPEQLDEIANKISKDKDDSRAHALLMLETAIELALASYTKTSQKAFAQKIEKLLNAYQAIKASGNVRLQLVANML